MISEYAWALSGATHMNKSDININYLWRLLKRATPHDYSKQFEKCENQPK